MILQPKKWFAIIVHVGIPLSITPISLKHHAVYGLAYSDDFRYLTNDPVLGRRELFRSGVHAATLTGGSYSSVTLASYDTVEDEEGYDKLMDQFQTSTISWDSSSVSDRWSQLRYSTSSLSSKIQKLPNPTSPTLTRFPPSMEGTWLTTYKFLRTTFPFGRNTITSRVPGFGLGTCLSLPNIGYNPPPFPQKIRKGGYEDLAYGFPRRLEAFWPRVKVTSIRTGCGAATGDRDNQTAVLGPECLVTGEGCTTAENPDLHSPRATRVVMAYDGPTRGSRAMVSQAIDLSLVAHQEHELRTNEGLRFAASRSYVQYNIRQDLQLFYKEFLLLSAKPMETRDEGRVMEGRVRVAAFLPWGDNTAAEEYYDDSKAVAVYDYATVWKELDDDTTV